MKLRAAVSVGNLFWNSKNVIVDKSYIINLLLDNSKVQNCYNTKRDNSEIYYLCAIMMALNYAGTPTQKTKMEL